MSLGTTVLVTPAALRRVKDCAGYARLQLDHALRSKGAKCVYHPEPRFVDGHYDEWGEWVKPYWHFYAEEMEVTHVP